MLLVYAQTVIAILMASAFFGASAFDVNPYTITTSFTAFLIPWHAFRIIFSRYTSIFFTFLPPLAMLR
jgi:hypothetical protein